MGETQLCTTCEKRRLSEDPVGASEKKRKLEEDIMIADARNNLLLESAAQKDIEAYKKRSTVPQLGN